jgi:hypothetical protein
VKEDTMPDKRTEGPTVAPFVVYEYFRNPGPLQEPRECRFECYDILIVRKPGSAYEVRLDSEIGGGRIMREREDRIGSIVLLWGCPVCVEGEVPLHLIAAASRIEDARRRRKEEDDARKRAEAVHERQL